MAARTVKCYAINSLSSLVGLGWLAYIEKLISPEVLLCNLFIALLVTIINFFSIFDCESGLWPFMVKR